MKVLLTNIYREDLTLEQGLLQAAGHELLAIPCTTPEEVIEAGQDVVAIVTPEAPITEAVFAALPKVRMVTTGGVGVDHVDLEAAKAHGVWVTNVPDENINEVATHSLAMILALIRHLPFYDRSVRDGEWDYAATGPMQRPNTMTLGIVGLGQIGREVARLAQPCFRQVLGYDPYLPASAIPAYIQRMELEALFQQSHAVSIHTPLTAETHHLVNRNLLAQMQRGSYLVNNARGSVVEIDALLTVLDSGHLAGAAIDVLPQEPPPSDHPLRHHPRVLLTPHAAFYSLEAEEGWRRKSMMNVVTWYETGRPPYVIVEGN